MPATAKPVHPAWYYNLKSHPQMTVQVLDRTTAATAAMLSGEALTQAWRQIVAAAPLYADYEKQTTREIPRILLRPNP
jgi:F420H(2)-dependent quinone reductase